MNKPDTSRILTMLRTNPLPSWWDEQVRLFCAYLKHLESSNYCHECHSKMHIDAETRHKANAYDALIDCVKNFKLGGRQ